MKKIFTLFVFSSLALAQAPKLLPKSVYQISPVTDGAITGAGIVVTALPYLFSANWINYRCPCNPSEVNSFDRGSIGNHSRFAMVYSDAVVVGAVAAPIVLDWIDLGSTPPFLEDMVVYAEALAISSGLVTIVKHLVQRPLPLTYSGHEPQLSNQAEGYRSFYSGHTTTAFTALAATATTLSLRYDAGLLPWIGAGLLGSSVAYARVQAGRHFPTDVLVGALAGSAVGFLVPWLHARRDGNSKTSFLVIPEPEGMRAMWVRNF